MSVPQEVAAASILPSETRMRNDTNIDWENPQNARISFSLRLANAFFANEWCSDMTFYVPMDDRIVPAHSIIIASASPTLERFCFSTVNKKDGTIVTVPDYCTTEVLHIVLRYLYIGGSAEGIDESNVGIVLKLADYYELCELQNQCETTIRSLLSDANVCRIYNDIHSVSNELVDECLRYMRENTEAILRNGSAMEMEDEALTKLLDANIELNMQSEFQVAGAMIKWADAQCISRAIGNNPVNRRHVLGKRINLINFGSLDFVKFMVCVEKFGLGFFTDKEISLTTLQIHRLGTAESSNDEFLYPFASYKRFFPVVEGTCEIDIGHRIDCVAEHIFVMNVSHMKKPFTLTGIQTYNMVQICKITNYCTSAQVPFIVNKKNYEFIVEPDEVGYISLGFLTNTKEYIYHFPPFTSANLPKMEFSATCLSSFKYTNPK